MAHKGVKWQLADLPPLVLTSSGQEWQWQIHIATDI